MKAIPLLYAAVAAILATLVSGRPVTVGGELALIGVFVVTYWAKCSSADSFVSTRRTIWSQTQRRDVQLSGINALPRRTMPVQFREDK